MILLLQYTLIFASVLILVALGGCFAEHSGVINLGLEGIMIMGALGGALTMRYVPNTVPAIVMILAVILVSALVGMVYSCLLAVASINFKADQTLVGTALNLLGTAGATVIVKAINTAANPDDVSSIVQYGSAKNALLAPIGSFEFNWFMLVAFIALVTAYGPDAFGPDKSFVAAQASVVATMVSGIPSVPWFAGGFIAGIAMYWLGIPAMMIGLGVYLPFYMSLTAFLGSCVKLAYDKWAAHRDANAGLSDEEKTAKDAAFQEQGLVVASGLLGGESIVGVILAFVSVGLSLLG
mgnify:FL=1